MIDMMNRPVMRYVDAFPYEEGGDSLFYIRDPQEIATSPLVVSPAELFILSMFDGQHSPRDIKMEFASQFQGILLDDEHIFQLIQILDENYYLNSPRFRDYYEELQMDFRKATVRPAWHAGGSYPKDSEMLRAQIDAFYNDTEGAGLPLRNGKLNAHPVTHNLVAIMAPHIDLRVGGACYTHAYKPLIEAGNPADVYIILGVAHYGGGGFFTATAKDFETPLGVVQTDRAFIEKWGEYAGTDFTKGDWAHRTEHSIEFQLPFLQHSFSHSYQIVPILCGSPEPHIRAGKQLDQVPEINKAISALKRVILEDGRNIQIILSVDLAHMGPKFDDPFKVDETKAAEIRTADETMFRIISEFDPEEFHNLMEKDLLKRNVDACSAIFTLMQLMKKSSVKTVGYQQNLQPDTQSIVTFGSMVFYGELASQ
ncbi:MAG: AmmeMemoRadiSam system protein B [Calditrichia bacterium]